ncbi:expressed unknown protein [Seminavis robusta]|uniref:Uncharacterized protein n=1 Tax=Seminavis robusta TaxID=568900 RepID=A0A9N8ED26_9STRA|nr:expressed unknown protein [Seminavis robusta]|eukprot:Sro818_g206940.1 n/a (350) ;mRNA; r:23825-25067
MRMMRLLATARSALLVWALLLSDAPSVHGHGSLRSLQANSTSDDGNATDSNNDAPTMTPIPFNDLCINAEGPVPVTKRLFDNSNDVNNATGVMAGTTVGATRADQETFNRCAGISFTGVGVWYYVFGTGSILTASTCWPGTDLDTKLSIFSGPNCTSLVCTQGNDDASTTIRGACQHNRLASRASWDTQINQLYYILVHGFNNRVGNFELSVESNNDRCDKAIALSPGDSIRGDSRGALTPFPGTINRCKEGGGLVGEGPSLWYTVMGSGSKLQATTCTDSGQDVSRTFKIHVFESTCGDSDSCIGGHSPTSGCSRYEWDAEDGTEYYILVHAFTASFSGVFDLTISEA